MSADQSAAQMLSGGVASSLSPLADRLRPASMQVVRGQFRVTRPGGDLLNPDGSPRGHSCVLWGPPGVGKTSVALLYAGMVDSNFINTSGTSFNRSVALATLEQLSSPEVASTRALFIDEIHRVTVPVQQLVASYLQRSRNLVVVGCTTENPSFELSPSLAAQCKVHVMDAVASDQIMLILADAVVRLPDTWARRVLIESEEVMAQIAAESDGDARRALSELEVAYELADATNMDGTAICAALQRPKRRFDNRGEMHYDQVSALFKSVRSTNPDAALYWLARMRDGGESVAYMARALTRMGLEDIGLADPRALSMSRNAWRVHETFGGELSDLALSQLALYLGATGKSNYTSKAVSAARARVRAGWHGEVERQP